MVHDTVVNHVIVVHLLRAHLVLVVHEHVHGVLSSGSYVLGIKVILQLVYVFLSNLLLSVLDCPFYA